MQGGNTATTLGRVRLAHHGSVAEICLTRPDKGNAVDMAMACDLGTALALVDDGTGCVLLTAEGPNFCVGGDVAAFGAADDPGEFLGMLADVFHAAVERIAASSVPVVAAVRGWAAGAGMSVACHCDVVVVGPSTRFKAAYPALGLSPDGGMSWALPRLVGVARATEILLTNRTLDADEAARIGLASRVAADDDGVHAEALRIAQMLASAPHDAMAATRRLVRDGEGRGLRDHLDAEARSISTLAGGSESRGLVSRFVAGQLR